LKWPFSKRKKDNPADRFSDGYIEELLKDTDNIELTRIPAIFPLLLTRSDVLKRRTASMLTKHAACLTILELAKLDALFRERTSLDWSMDWSKENPENLLLPNMPEEQRVIILGLCSFHPNGYFREKALILLNQYTSGKEWPFLLLRCKDWVAAVRGAADKYVERRLNDKYMAEIVSSLPLVFKWQLKKEHLFQQVAQVLSQPESLPFLKEGTSAKDRNVRYFCYQMIMHANLYDKELLVNLYKKEKDPLVRQSLFNELVSSLKAHEFKEHYSIFKRDKFPSIRLKGLEVFHSYFPEISGRELEAALLDKSSTIRYFARFLLKKQKTSIDFSSFYMGMLNANQYIRESLLGIGETGSKEQAQLIQPYLYHSRISITKAAIHAISKLDGAKYKQEFIQLLQSEMIGISKAARKAIAQHYYEDIKDYLYDIYKEASYEHTKYNIAILLCSLSKWEAIFYSISFYVQCENREVSRLGKSALLKWINHFNRSFVTPSSEQMNALITLLSSNRERLQNEEATAIEFYMKGFH